MLKTNHPKQVSFMPTLKEIAKTAGVSTSTVSKALNNSPDISQETRDQIVDLAIRMGYQRKFRKRAAGDDAGISGPKIGLIYTDIISRYYSRVVEAYGRRIHELGGVMLACDARFSKERAAALCNYLDQQCHVDGIISVYAFQSAGDCPHTRAPMVGSFGHKALASVMGGQIPCDMICLNNRTGLNQAFEKLLELGHRNFAYVGENHSAARETLFRELAAEHGIDVPSGQIRSTGLRFEEAGYHTMRSMLEEGCRPTAVFCAYDDIAVGASKAILEMGLRIPEDLSLIGFDNSMLRLYNQKILASVDSFIEDQTARVLNMLMRRIQNPGDTIIQNVALQTAFVPHETIGPAPDRK